MTEYISIKNNQTVTMDEIPILEYEEFYNINSTLIKNKDEHCVNYFGISLGNELKLFCCMANDLEHTIRILSSRVKQDSFVLSLTAQHHAFHAFERELHENYGLKFTNHPWLKPFRYSSSRVNKALKIDNYPFYKSESNELHEVGVGPIHAGIIEPGHFRFICNGEQILHLETQLGYQHRGIEKLFLEKKKLLQRTTLAENIAGDTVCGHTVCFVNLWESLCGFKPESDLQIQRSVSMELERIAVHTADLSALCADIGYQLGNSVFGRLRTPLINFFQEWCGNRFAKGLIRAGKTNFPFPKELIEKLSRLLNDYEYDFLEMYSKLKNLPSALSRLEKTGTVSQEQVSSIGAVGMTARASGSVRDIRTSHPYNLFTNTPHQPIIKHHGDVYSRIQIRKEEIMQSISYIRSWISEFSNLPLLKKELKYPKKNSFTVSLTEGWRGEICHCAITDENGELLHYKVKDPSLHNWLALGLAVRNNEISDFPVCNKSFNLSYCGNDL